MMDTPPEPPPAQEQVIEQKLLDCGLKAGGFTVRYEDYLQSIEVVITPEAETTPDHFRCIHEAVFPKIVTFPDGDMYQRYMAYVGELFRPQVLADAEAGLKERGLWAGFPERSSSATLDDFAHALESHAGFKPRSVLRAEGDKAITVDPVDRNLFANVDYERLATLFVVLTFASARDGFAINIIGNDKVAFKLATDVVEAPASTLDAEVLGAVKAGVHARCPDMVIAPYMESGGTDGMHYRALGLNTVAISGAAMRDADMFAHGLNERIRVEDFYAGLDHWSLILKHLAD